MKGRASPSPSGGGDVQLGCGWESVVVGLYTLFGGRGCTDWVLVGSLLLVACTRSLDGVDVQIECGFLSLLVVWDCLFGRWGCAWWGSDVGCWYKGKGKENGSKSNV